MKLVYFYPTMHSPGGMERVLTIKLNYLADVFGYEVHLITYRQYDRENYFQLSDKINQIKLNIEHTYGIKDKNKIKEIRSKFKKEYKNKVEEILHKINADVAITTLFGEEYEFLTSINDGSKKIAEYHFSFLVSKLNRFRTASKGLSINAIKNKFYFRKELKILSSYDKFILLTKRDTDSWSPYLSNITYINNPITITNYENIVSSLNNKIVIAVGRLTNQKGFDMLIESWYIIKQKSFDWQLHIYGEGELKEQLNNKINELDLNHSVKILPPTNNIHQKMLNASIFVLPSRFEGLPLVLMESMYFGLPSVSFDCECGPSDLVKNDESGYLVSQNDIQTFSKKLIDLISNEQRRVEFGKKSKELSENYKIENIMHNWQKLFKTL